MHIDTFCLPLSLAWPIGALPAPHDPGNPRRLVILFGTPGLLETPEPVHRIVQRYPQAAFIGCSTAGEISGPKVVDDSLSGAIIEFEHTELATSETSVSSTRDSFAAGEHLAQELLRPGLCWVLVTADGLRINGSELCRGLGSVLPASIGVSGALAGDGKRFQHTWVLQHGTPQEGGVCAVGLYGDRIRLCHGLDGGWDSFGPERLITRSRANVLFELDGKPALDLYKSYLGDLAAGLPATGLRFPLLLRPVDRGQARVVRTILGVDEEQRALVFAGDVPEGCRAKLMRASFDRLVDGAVKAAVMAQPAEGYPIGKDTLAIVISCVGRRLVLGERTEEEVEATQATLPAGTRQVGLYSYGEMAPAVPGGCSLHNQTMTITTLAEV